MKEWRERHELWLPRFPREKIIEIDSTLEYPDAADRTRGRTAMTRWLAVAGLWATALVSAGASVRFRCTRRCLATTRRSVDSIGPRPRARTRPRNRMKERGL